MPPSSTQQFSGIFVSYRRDDSSGHAGRLADRLVEHFGRNRIFVDIDTIEPGEDFVTVIENAVGSCEILIAVIGQKWLSGSGSGQLDNPNNFVRLEIATALRRNIRVIPVLVQRASMPKAQDLPEDLINLTRRNAIELSDLRWQSDVDQLISVMERVLGKRADAQQLVTEDTKLRAHRPSVEAEQTDESLHAEQERRKAAARSEEDETAQEREQSNSPASENRSQAPATVVPRGTTQPASKQRRLMVIAGASVMVLLAATILILLSQRDPGSSGNTIQAAPVQSSVVTQPATTKPAPIPELKPAPPADPFAEPTLWQRSDGGTILQIVRNGNTITAIMNSPSRTAAAAGRTAGDLAFKGSYKDRTIKGTAYIRFSEKDVSRCPEFNGEQKSDLELTLSEDGNTLIGSREDYNLSAECTITPLPRKRLKYTRTSP
jgi:hypothetical protein